MTGIEQATLSWQPGPRNPSLDEGEIHVWRADLDLPDWPPADALPPDEQARAARLSEPTARRWVASRWALRTVLSRYLDEHPASIAIRIDPHGKPVLAEDPPRLHFNLSHSSDLALIAVCRDHEVGVDVERIRPRRNLMRLAERVLAEDAAEAVLNAPVDTRLTVFHEAWTRHEAALKCLGSVHPDVPLAPRPTFCSLQPRPGYVGALAGGALATRPPRLISL